MRSVLDSDDPRRQEVPEHQHITRAIFVLRGHRVLLDTELAALDGVSIKRFNEQVRRNCERFPADFMFQLTAEELAALRSQFATSNAPPQGRGARRSLPHAFTEHGAIMAATWYPPLPNLSPSELVGVAVVCYFGA